MDVSKSHRPVYCPVFSTFLLHASCIILTSFCFVFCVFSCCFPSSFSYAFVLRHAFFLAKIPGGWYTREKHKREPVDTGHILLHVYENRFRSSLVCNYRNPRHSYPSCNLPIKVSSDIFFRKKKAKYVKSRKAVVSYCQSRDEDNKKEAFGSSGGFSPENKNVQKQQEEESVKKSGGNDEAANRGETNHTEEDAIGEDTYVSPLGIDWEKAFDILQDTKEVGMDPAVVAYNAALSAYERNSHYEGSLKALEDMHKQKLPPDVVSYALVMSACEKAHMLNKVIEVYRQMRNRGRLLEKIHTEGNERHKTGGGGIRTGGNGEYIPNNHAESRIHPSKNIYEILLSCFNKQGKGRKAVEIFEEMKRDAIIQNIGYPAFANVISACESEAMYDSVLRYFDEMQKRSIPLSLYVINKVLSAYTNLYMPEEALNLFGKMKGELNIQGDINTYNYLLRVCAKCYKIDTMEKIWVELLSGGRKGAVSGGQMVENQEVITVDGDDDEYLIFPNLQSYEACIEGYALTNDSKKAAVLVDDLIFRQLHSPRNTKAFHLALNACIENGEHEIAVSILRKMQQYQINLSVHTYNLVMKSSAAAENWKALLSLFYEMMAKYIHDNNNKEGTNENLHEGSDKISKEEYTNREGNNVNNNKALDKIETCRKSPLHANNVDKCTALSLGLRALCQLHMYTEAEKLIEFVSTETSLVTSPVLRKAVEFCNKKMHKQAAINYNNNRTYNGSENNKHESDNEARQTEGDSSVSPFSSFLPPRDSGRKVNREGNIQEMPTIPPENLSGEFHKDDTRRSMEEEDGETTREVPHNSETTVSFGGQILP